MFKRKKENNQSVHLRNNTKIKGQNTYRAITLAIFITVAIIAICNTLCILAVSFPETFGLQLSESLSSEEKIEAAILSDCVALIGLAIAVWTGLNIANSIESREVAKLQHRVYELGEEIKRNTSEMKKRNLQLNMVDKSRFLYELEDLNEDVATQELHKIFQKGTVALEIPFLKLLEIEQNFKRVYFMHDSKYDDNEELKKTAKHGIKLAEDVASNTEDNIARLYLNFRIAEFHFYMGYCCLGKECASHFLEAIKRYRECADDFQADIPQFDYSEIYPNIKFLPCKKNNEISAYFCNSIGEAYSKIVHNNKGDGEKCSDNDIKLYSSQAVFYCAYAIHWGSKTCYIRNYGCAFELHYGKQIFVDDNLYGVICSEYETALKREPENISNFKNKVSAYDKYVNNILSIEFVHLPSRRIPSLDSTEFATIWKNIRQKEEVATTLESIRKLAHTIKTLFPGDGIGYQYACIYFRDMCAIYGNHTLETDEAVITRMKQAASRYLEQAEENWSVLNIVSSYDPYKPYENPMTQILRNDLDDLKKLL